MSQMFIGIIGIVVVIGLAIAGAVYFGDQFQQSKTKPRAAAAVAGTSQVAHAATLLERGDINRIITLVDSKVMPNVNFEAMTRSAVGPQWRSATPEQRGKLQAEFKTLLVRVYAGALTQLKDQTVEVTKTQAVPGGAQMVVQSQVVGKGDPIKLDYRLDKVDASWKIIDVNVGGIWLVTSYRSQFAQELSTGGIDGLIAKLVERNKGSKS